MVSNRVSEEIEQRSTQNRRITETEWLQRKMRSAMHRFKNGLANADRVQKTIRTYGSSDAFSRLFVDR